MKISVFVAICPFTMFSFSQETVATDEEFIPIHIEAKEAFMSTKTGEYIFMKHEDTDESQLRTTDKGVVYKDISIHTIRKGESLYTIAKKYGLTVDKLKKDNYLSSVKLKIGQELKIKINRIIASSSPVISSEPSRIIAKLPPNESPFGLNPPPSAPPTNSTVITSKPNSEITSEEGHSDTSRYYNVKKGDSLYSIAKAHNMTVQELKALNNLTLNNLSIGKKLLLK